MQSGGVGIPISPKSSDSEKRWVTLGVYQICSRALLDVLPFARVGRSATVYIGRKAGPGDMIVYCY